MAKPNGAIKIDKGVPIPPRRAGAHKYPWYDMEIGDSFFTEEEKVRAAASKIGPRTGHRYATRAEGDGYRVWRVE